jgi:hypothetical protein
VEGGQGSTAHLKVGLEPAGMSVAEAYADARFLQALHVGGGKLVFTMLEPRRDSVTAALLCGSLERRQCPPPFLPLDSIRKPPD